MADHEQKITPIFIINGENFPINTNINAPIAAAAERALAASGNNARPLSEWQLRDSNGVLIDMTRKVEDLGLKNGTRLFLSLRVGAGGVSAT